MKSGTEVTEKTTNRSKRKVKRSVEGTEGGGEDA